MHTVYTVLYNFIYHLFYICICMYTVNIYIYIYICVCVCVDIYIYMQLYYKCWLFLLCFFC